jgi:hypothetical protein
LRGAYFEELDRHLDGDRRDALVVDKLPLNAVRAGLIHRMFPNAKFLFALRHPCDSVLSCFMQRFGLNNAMAQFLDLGDAARYYDKVMSLWMQYRAVLPLDVHTLRYEDLVRDFRTTIGDVLDFLALDWDDSVFDYIDTAKKRGKINTPSHDQVIQPLYSRASGRWRKYEDQMKPVLPLLLPWAERFGYGDGEENV